MTKKTTQIIINSFIGATGLGFPSVLPMLIGAIVDTLGYSRAMVGWISSANILGIAVGGLIATLLIGKRPLVQIVRVGLLGLLLFDTLSMFVEASNIMIGTRFLSGVFGGLVYAGGLAAFSGLKNPIKAYGIYVIVFCIWSGFVMVILPFLMQYFGLVGGFGVLVGMAVVSLLGSGVIPHLAKNIQEKELDLSFLLKQKEVGLALLGYFAIMLAGGTTFTYAERIAKEAGLDTLLTGQLLGASTILALLGGLLVFKLGDSKGLRMPIFLGVVTMGAGVLLLFWSTSPIIYFIGISLFGGAWSFAIPFYQQIQSKFDPTGKVVSLGTIVNTLGRATGPALAALFLGGQSFTMVLWLSLVALVLSLVAVFPLLMRR